MDYGYAKIELGSAPIDVEREQNRLEGYRCIQCKLAIFIHLEMKNKPVLGLFFSKSVI